MEDIEEKQIAKEIFLHLTDYDRGFLAPQITKSQSPIDTACEFYQKILKAVKGG